MDIVDILPLYEMLTEITIKINWERQETSGVGRTRLFGVNPRNKKQLSRYARDYPEIYEELKKIASKYCPFPVENFMVNHNYQTKPHVDKQNVGLSMVFSFGDYEEGILIVKDKEYDTYLNPVIMDIQIFITILLVMAINIQLYAIPL